MNRLEKLIKRAREEDTEGGLRQHNPNMITAIVDPTYMIVDEAPAFHLNGQVPIDPMWNEMMAMIDLFLHPDDYFLD